MDVRIDNKKMWESLYKAVDINLAAEISIALRDQGLTVNNNGEIVSIEPEQEIHPHSESNELTDFEKVLAELIGMAQNSALKPLELAALHSDVLMQEARKQLQPEIDAELELAYKNQDEILYHRGYEKGKEDAIKEFYNDFRQGEKHFAQIIADMLANGWGLKTIQSKCEETIKGE